MPFETLGHWYRSMLQPILQISPIDTLVNGVAVGCWSLVVEHPIERHDGCVELAHEILADVVHAMLVVSFVHFGYRLLLRMNVG